MFQGIVRSYHPNSGVQRQRSQVMTLPPPVGGWNARDALPEISAIKTNYQQAEALVLDNWIPTYGGVQIRKGYEDHVTGLTGDYVETLMPYQPATGTAKLFAATPTIIYDVTTAGAPASSVTSMTNGRWSHVNFATAATRVLYICNGADTPRYWNGTAWTTTTFTGTGLTVTNLNYVHAHLFRLWFAEKDTLYAWYGDTMAVGGALALNKLDLGAMCRLGGELIAIGSLTRDGGAGTDDWIVFVTDKGEVVTYAGTDPSTITGSALVGVFRIPEPIGARCLLPLGGDLAVLTKIGLVSLSQTMGLDENTARKTAVSNKISGAFHTADAATSSDHGSSNLFGWQVVNYPHEELAIVNVPLIERGTTYQYVLNTGTGAWCRFKGIEASSWALFGSHLFFGGQDGAVYHFDHGNTDNGEPIVANMVTAFHNFGTPAVKVFNLARPLFAGPLNFAPRPEILLDYDTTIPEMQTASTDIVGPEWDVAAWDEEYWASDEGTPVLRWKTVHGQGTVGAVAFSIGASSPVIFNGIDVNFETGGIL
jgi:hypothetical protein